MVVNITHNNYTILIIIFILTAFPRIWSLYIIIGKTKGNISTHSFVRQLPVSSEHLLQQGTSQEDNRMQ